MPQLRHLVLLLTLLVTLLAAKLQPAKREYTSHTYYVLELDPRRLPPDSSPHDVALALGAEHVEQVGELRDHYLVRAPVELVSRGDVLWESEGKRGGEKRGDQRDAVMERYEVLRRRRRLAARGGGQGVMPLGVPVEAIRSLERQYPRLRVKRDLPVLPPATLDPRSPPTHPRLGTRQEEPETPPSRVIEEAQARFGIVDPVFPKQWHLVNNVIEENSVNVTGVWAEGVFGKGVNVAIVDDGLDMHSDDLAPNFHAEGSWDYNDNTALPEPRLSDDQHGTRCAGEIAAAKNDVCGVGIAYQAGIAGIRILSASISDADEASSLNYGYQTNDIYSCSWGPPDDGRSMEAPGRLIVKAMLNGVQNGRGGKGSVYVFASGNGGAVDDQCNFDGYTNSLMSITVGAIDRKGLHPYYSEACAANMVVTYSSGSGDNIHTTDVGKNACTDRHGGTSAAAPIAAGIFALVLEVRPDLTWRDMQHLCVQTAVQINPDDPDWQMTASGRNFNHKYGFGKLDAWAIVNAARSWPLVKPQTWWNSPRSMAESAISSDGATAEIVVTATDLQGANFELLEHVTVTVHIDHQRRGNIEVELVSPRGMKSILARPRRFDDSTTGIPNWVFMTVKHWDEDPVGKWTLRVRDRQTNGKNGTFLSWSMQLWGSTIDASKAELWQVPGGEQEAEQDEAEVPTDTDEATASPTDEPVATGTPEAEATKTYARPTVGLPDDHAEAPGEAHSTFGEPGPTPTAVDDSSPPSQTTDSPLEEDDPDIFDNDASGYLAGMSSLLGSSTWLFVAGGTIVIFVAAVSAFFFMRSRKSGRAGRGGGYDFAPMTDDEEGLPMSAMERGRTRMGGGSRSARTRDLYDAFALAESESEDEEDDDEEKRRAGRTRPDVAYNDDAMESFLDDPATPLAAGTGEGVRKKEEKPFKDNVL